MKRYKELFNLSQLFSCVNKLLLSLFSKKAIIFNYKQKRDTEFAIQKLGQAGLNVSIARCFSFVGKYLPKDKHFAIGNFIADGIAGRNIEVKASKKVYRSYMYADDLVLWLMTIADNSNPQCPVYNVASDKEVEIKELADIVANIFKVRIKSSENSAKHVDRYIPSTQKS